jgi:hypothetical protein
MSETPAAETARRLAHRRQIVCTGYVRDDGLYDIEASMLDTKGHHANLLFKEVPAGGAIHDMRLTITIDENLVIRGARAHTETAPTPHCAEINAAYAKLAGIAIGNGFMKEVKARLGGAHGCTHLTELLGPMATTAFQTIMGLKDHRHAADVANAPALPLLDTCHAWRAGGEVVQRLGSPAGERPAPEHA